MLLNIMLERCMVLWKLLDAAQYWWMGSGMFGLSAFSGGVSLKGLVGIVQWWCL